METTIATWIVAIAGLILMGLLGSLQLVAVIRPRAQWTIDNVYGGEVEATDATAYFAFNRGLSWADVAFWAPIQIAGSIGMLLGARWGFLLALSAAVPYVYTAITIFVWDRDLGYQKNTFFYWVVIWAMWPAFGLVQGVYCFARLLG